MNRLAPSKKAQAAGLSLIAPLTIAILIGFVTLAVGSDVLTQTGNNNQGAACINDISSADFSANCSSSFNATNAGNHAIIEFSNFGSTIGLVGVALVVMGMLFAFSRLFGAA